MAAHDLTVKAVKIIALRYDSMNKILKQTKKVAHPIIII